MKGRRRKTILLRDLDPGKDVRGGAGKRLFGEQEETFEPPPEPVGVEAPKPATPPPSTTKRDP
jgi:hypothetical protein